MPTSLAIHTSIGTGPRKLPPHFRNNAVGGGSIEIDPSPSMWKEIRMTIRGNTWIAMAGSSVLTAALMFSLGANQPSPQQDGPPPGAAALSGDALMAGLKQTEGCLGIDAGQWQSGKRTIIAWFEDKAAVQRWYYSNAHKGAMKAFAPDAENDTRPLGHVPNDTGPIMVLATLTMSDKPPAEGINMPVSQISIELFKPLPGGAYIGGRLAPETFKVPHMRNLTP